LKALILNEKKKMNSLIRTKDDVEELSPLAQKYEPIFLKYVKEIEKLGKNWKCASVYNYPHL